MTAAVLNAFTVDVEDYFQVSALSNEIPRSDWDKRTLRVEKNTHVILNLLDEKAIKGTFFVLGWIAEKCPGLVREIAARGHEIASHGYSHELIYKQTPEQFKQETLTSKSLLEDISGEAVNGYRAASYSITQESYWALDIIYEAGFLYDSSIYPIYHDRYGIPGAKEHPHFLETDKGNTLLEFPLTTYKFMGVKVPISGGGYFRLYPYWFSRQGLMSVNKAGHNAMFYLHPWEIDADQPRVKTNWLSRFRHYNNLDKCEARLTRLLDDFKFTSVAEVLKHQQLLAEPVA